MMFLFCLGSSEFSSWFLLLLSVLALWASVLCLDFANLQFSKQNAGLDCVCKLVYVVPGITAVALGYLKVCYTQCYRNVSLCVLMFD